MKNRKKSTRQLVGIEDIVAGGVQTADGELTFYLVQPTNLNVLPDQGVRSRVMALLNVLKAMAEIELLALDSKESFQDNRSFYQRRLEQETNPALRALLVQDSRHLDDVQTLMASARVFGLVLRQRQDGSFSESYLANVEKQISDSGFTVHRAGEQELRELLAVYFEQDVSHEVYDRVDGERYVT